MFENPPVHAVAVGIEPSKASGASLGKNLTPLLRLIRQRI